MLNFAAHRVFPFSRTNRVRRFAIPLTGKGSYGGLSMAGFLISLGFLAGAWMTFLAVDPGTPRNPIC